MKIVGRLEQNLRHLEDTYFIMNACAMVTRESKGGPAFPLQGPIVHFPEFRKWLLTRKPGEVFDHDRFSGKGEAYDAIGKLLGHAADFPLYLTGWTVCSRRVYRLTSELQLLLNATSLQDVLWSDIHLPFDSFAIALENPIVDSKGKEFDTIMVLRFGDTRDAAATVFLGFFVLCSDVEKLPPLSEAEKIYISRIVRKKKFERLKSFLNKRDDETRKHILDFLPGWEFLLKENRIADMLVTASLNELAKKSHGESKDWYEDERPVCESAMRIVLGLCMYLKSLPPLPAVTPYRSDWTPIPHPRKDDPLAVTKGSEVCTVSSIYTISEEERMILTNIQRVPGSQGGWEVRAHFREGHWRRPKGKGHDPTAQKTVWVRPTIVRRDRLPEGGVPGGTEKVLDV